MSGNPPLFPIALEKLKEVHQLAREQTEREEQIRQAINAGKTVDDLLKEFGRI